jgi:membrane-associated phospholipid phosphatase
MAVGRAGWWAADYVFMVYLPVTAALIACYFGRVPGAGWLMAAHAAGVALIVALGWRPRRPPQPGKLPHMIHEWYPLGFIPLCYKEMAILIPAIRGVDYDAAMSRLDTRLWGIDPVLWMDRLQNPWLSEYLQVVYTLFIPSVIGVAVWLWFRDRQGMYRYYQFLISLGFLASYLGYFAVPVRGPRIYLAAMDLPRLHGVWLFDTLQRVLDQLESAHYDCFPSGHTEMTIVAWWASRSLSGRVFAGFSIYTVSIMFATIYLRYHYTIDVFAGAVLAAVILLAAPRLYAAAERRRQDEPVDC